MRGCAVAILASARTMDARSGNMSPPREYARSQSSSNIMRKPALLWLYTNYEWAEESCLAIGLFPGDWFYNNFFIIFICCDMLLFYFRGHFNFYLWKGCFHYYHQHHQGCFSNSIGAIYGAINTNCGSSVKFIKRDKRECAFCSWATKEFCHYSSPF